MAAFTVSFDALTEKDAEGTKQRHIFIAFPCVLCGKIKFCLHLPPMYLYIIAIGWAYVVLMMAVTAKSVIAGALTFIFYGLLPLGLVLYITLKQLKRSRMAAQNRFAQPDRADTEPDQERLL
jgi:uncharacterized membrane protein